MRDIDLSTIAAYRGRWTELQRELASQVPTDTTLPACDLVAWLDDVADYVVRKPEIDLVPT